MRLSRVILFLLICTFIAQSAIYYFILPDMVAAHFNGAGKPDSWWPKAWFFVFDVGILLILVSEFTLVPRWIEKMPGSMMNLPNKKYWLAPGRRAETFTVFRHYFEWFAVLLFALFIVVNQLVFRANLRQENLDAVGIWSVVVIFILAVIFWLAKFINHFRTVN